MIFKPLRITAFLISLCNYEMMNTTKLKTLILLLMSLSCLPATSQSSDNPLLYYWSFDDTAGNGHHSFPERSVQKPVYTQDANSTDYETTGLINYVPGVKGSAIKFDGFSTYAETRPEPVATGDEKSAEDFKLPGEISVEAWVALGAYPWNWAPVLTTGKYKITGFYFGIDSRGRVGFQISDGTSVWHECRSEADPVTKLGLQLRKWYHITGTYSRKDGLTVYINGEPAGRYNDFVDHRGIVYSEKEKGFRLGMNREMLPPSDPIRAWATFPSRYSIDGMIDEVKVYGTCLSADEVKKFYNSVKPENEPKFAPRRFPSVKPSGRFAANYTRLYYYPEWDAIWPVDDFSDIAVQFDELPVKIMFWRGTRYSPCLVSENGKWMADQSRETGGNWFLSQGSRDEFPTGCMEHMSDVQCRSSRVSIIESNEARIVVQWRYLQMDVRFRQHDLPNNSGFGEWGNELYYIYPDGVMVRKVLPGYGGWQETIFLSEPGTRPEDNVDLTATTLVNLKGESKSYSWKNGYPVYDLPDGIIQVVNFKSQFKPYLILRDGGDFKVFNGEVRPEYSHFPWWNHWPVAQISSDGRGAIASDRASHSSLSWGNPNGTAALYGMTDKDPKTLVALARSWNFPPEIRFSGPANIHAEYDYTQRAYLIDAGGSTKRIRFTLQGSNESPLVNPAFVITNWTHSDMRLTINGKDINHGKDFRYSTVYDVEGNPSVIVWVKYQADEKTEFELLPMK